MPIKGKQIINNTVDLKKLAGGIKILPSSALLGTNKTVLQITNNKEFTSKEYVDFQINNLSATNGLTEYSYGTFGLGGILTQNTSIVGNNQSLILGDSSNLLNFTLNSENNINIKSFSGDIILNGTNSNVIINNLKYPLFDGTNGQVIISDGNGNLSFSDRIINVFGTANEIVTQNISDKIYVGLDDDPIMPGSYGVKLPIGDTLTRGTDGTTGINGYIRYNSDYSRYEAFENNKWKYMIDVPATETIAGIAEIATQQEVDEGTNGSNFVTPFTLRKGKPNGVATLDETGKTPSGELSGGAKSMILSFGSDITYEVNTNDATYRKVATFIYAGSNDVSAIKEFSLNVWVTGGGSGDARIYDASNALVLSELTNVTSTSETNFQSMGVVTNIPTTVSIFEIQMKRNSGGTTMHCGSVEVRY